MIELLKLFFRHVYYQSNRLKDVVRGDWMEMSFIETLDTQLRLFSASLAVCKGSSRPSSSLVPTSLFSHFHVTSYALSAYFFAGQIISFQQHMACKIELTCLLITKPDAAY